MNRADTAPAEFLPWDSDFFAFRIGRVHPGVLDGAALELWRRDNHIRCLYYLAELEDTQSIHAAEGMGFRLMDVRSTFILDLPRPTEGKCDCQVRQAQPEDLPQLVQISTGIFKTSRFYQDAHFPVLRVDQMYNHWLEKHFGQPDTTVWVAEDESGILGFTSIEMEAGGIARLSLTGVHPAARGRGLAKSLKSHIIDYYSRAGLHRLKSITQGCNRPLIHLNFRYGFRLIKQQLWLHAWFDDPE